MENPRDRNTQVRQQLVDGAGFQLGAEQEGRRDQQVGIAGSLGGGGVGIQGVGLADCPGEGAQAPAFERHAGGGQLVADPLLVDHRSFLRLFRRG
ncbi:hypothetical protein D3C80_1981930 [compost metagenome]